MAKVIIDYEKYGGADCGECVDVCSMEVLVLEEDKIEIKCSEERNLCEVCTDACPNDAIVLENS